MKRQVRTPLSAGERLYTLADFYRRYGLHEPEPAAAPAASLSQRAPVRAMTSAEAGPTD